MLKKQFCGAWPVRLEVAATVAVALVLLGLYAGTQPIWDDRAVKWDAVDYLAMSKQIASGADLAAAAPFVYRIGFPAMAAFLSPEDPVSGMCLISIASGFLSVLLMWWWLSTFRMQSLVRLSLVAAFALQFHGPLRFGIFFSTVTYSTFWVFLLLGLILMREATSRPKRTPWMLAAGVATCFVGAFVREAMVIVPLSMLFLQPTQRAGSRVRHLGIVLPALAACLVAVGITHVLAAQTNDYGFLETATYWLSTKSALQLTAALFIAFGPMIAVLVVSPGQTIQFFARHRELAALIAASSILTVVGGTNTELFWYWSAPAVLAAVGVMLSQQAQTLLKPALALGLLGAQLISERAFWNFPVAIESEKVATVFFSPIGDSAYLQLWSNFAPQDVLLRVVVTNLAFILLYVGIARALKRKDGTQPRLQPDLTIYGSS